MPGEDRGEHNCPRALTPKGLALGSTHRACKHFLASFVFSHSISEPPPGTPSKHFPSHGGKQNTHPPPQGSTDRHWHCLLLPGGQREGRTQTGETPLPTLPGQPTHIRVAGREKVAGSRMGPCPDPRRRHEEGDKAAVLWLVTAGKCAMLEAAGRTGVLGHLLCLALF